MGGFDLRMFITSANSWFIHACSRGVREVVIGIMPHDRVHVVALRFARVLQQSALAQVEQGFV